MLKKVVLLVFVLAIATIQGAMTAECSVPPQFLFGDDNYIYCTGHTGVLFYADKSSVNVMEYEPPKYVISVDVVAASDMYKRSKIDLEPDRTNISEPKTYIFLYNWDNKEVYVLDEETQEWKFVNPNGTWADSGIALSASRLAFKIAYEMDFKDS